MSWLLFRIARDVLIVVGLSALLVSGAVFYTRSTPQTVDDARTPQHTKLEFEPLTFATSDGVELVGWFIPATTPGDSQPATIIGLHDFDLSKSQMLDWTYYLADTSNLVLFDFRGQGESSGTATYGKKEQQDLKAILAVLAERPDVDLNRLGVIGHGLGASVALLVAADEPRIKAVVADSPFDRLRKVYDGWFEKFSIAQAPMSWLAQQWSRGIYQTNPSKIAPVEAAASITQPVFLIAAEHDVDGAYQSSIAIRDQLDPARVTFWSEPGDYSQLFSVHRDAYKQKVHDFFDLNLAQ